MKYNKIVYSFSYFYDFPYCWIGKHYISASSFSILLCSIQPCLISKEADTEMTLKQAIMPMQLPFQSAWLYDCYWQVMVHWIVIYMQAKKLPVVSVSLFPATHLSSQL